MICYIRGRRELTKRGGQQVTAFQVYDESFAGPALCALKCWPNMALKIHVQELSLRVAVQFCLRHVGQRPGAKCIAEADDLQSSGS